MLFYRLLQQSVNTDPHPLADLVGGTAPDPRESAHTLDDDDSLHNNIFEDI